jgi:hypothetical protein
MRRFFAVLTTGLLAATAAPAADDAVVIKVKRSAPGDIAETTKTEKASNKSTINIKGTDRTQEQSGSSNLAYRDEVIERPADAKRPTKFKRTYKKAELMRDTAKVDLGLAGKTVLIEKKGDRYEFTVDGKPLTGPAAEFLGREFGREKHLTEEDFFPKEPVKVGGTWKIDVAQVAKELGDEGMVVDPGKSSATGKLIKTYDKGGAKFGVLELTLDMTVKTLKGGGSPDISLKEGSKVTITMSADACIDGTLDTGKAKMTMKGNLSGEVMGMPIKIEMDVVQENASEEVKKK